MLIRVKPEQAMLGMYVQEFEGNWLSHPFWRARFVIASEDDLARIRNGGTDIFIDTAKGITPAKRREGIPETRVTAYIEPSPRTRAMAAIPPPPYRPKQAATRVVAPPAFGKADKVRAAALAQRSMRVVKNLFDNCRLGRSIEAPQILQVVQDIADTLEQNGAAFASVTRLKAKDDLTYTHSVAVCALMISLARETGAVPAVVQDLGLAGLLHDIGKLHIDDAILQKVDDLTADERTQISRHPELGYALLSPETGLPPVALDICLHHHERLDGSGYPFGLRDDSITPAARMAAICDVYDAMTSNRPYRKGKSPVEAVTEMEAMTGQFDQDLLFRFMRGIGVFPVGKLVRLRSNRLAAVLPTDGPDRRPVVRAFYATIGTHFIDYEDAVLGDGLNDDQAVSHEDPSFWFSTEWAAMWAQIRFGAPFFRPTELIYGITPSVQMRN